MIRCGLLLLGILLAGNAQALSFEIVSSDRQIYAASTSFCPGCGPNGEDEFFTITDSDGTTEEGHFDGEVNSSGSDALQDSRITTSTLSGSGSISVGGTGNDEASSSLFVQFRVGESGGYGIQGALTRSGFEDIDPFRVLLSQPGEGDIFRRESSGVFSGSFFLEAGTLYELSADVGGFGSGEGGDGAWSFAVVPEPGTALLLAQALGMLGVSRQVSRRRRL